MRCISRVMFSLFYLIFNVLFFYSANAQALYKCKTQNGTVTYTDQQCDGTSLVTSSKPISSTVKTPAEDALFREKAEVERLQKIREQRERQDQQIRDLSARGAAARQRKCQSLALQLRWREEDLREAPLQSVPKARVRARRAAEKYAMECR